jgi:predicted ester cyclase
MNTLSRIIHEANTTLLVNGAFDAVETWFAPDYHVHVTNQDIKGGPDLVRRILDMLRRAFPGIAVEVEILVEGEDRVAWQRTLRGVQSGAYQGFPATGKEIVWRDMVTSRFEEGRIVEDWVITDLAEQLLRARKS